MRLTVMIICEVKFYLVILCGSQNATVRVIAALNASLTSVELLDSRGKRWWEKQIYEKHMCSYKLFTQCFGDLHISVLMTAY